MLVKAAAALGALVLGMAGAQGALAMPSGFMQAYDVREDQMLLGRPAGASGFSFATGEALDDGAVLFEDVGLELGSGRRLDAESLTVAGNWLLIRDGVLSRNVEGQVFSQVALGAMRIDGPAAHEVLLMGPRDFCGVGSPDGAGGHLVEASGIRITAPSLGARAGLQSTEEISIDGLAAEFSSDAEGCRSFDFLRLQRLSSKTTEGDALEMAELMMAAKDIGGGAVQLDLQIADTAFKPATGGAPMRAGVVELRAALARDILDGGRDALLDGEALLGAGDADLSLAVSGIEIPAGELLPGHLLEKIRIGKDTRFDGRVSLGMALEGSRLRYGHDVDLTGLASSSASLELDLGQGNTFEDGLTGVMMAGSFVSGSFSHRDFGLASVIEAATGREMGDLLQQAVEVVPGPARLTAPVASWLTEALTGQGQVHAEPSNPVGLMQVGMTAAMAPANLVSLLELEVQ